MSKICEKASANIGARQSERREGVVQSRATEKRRYGFEAVSRHRDAAIAHGATIAAMMKATDWQQL
jgi:hypothetical protein